MKYLKEFFVCGLVLIITSSYTTRTPKISEGINQGNLIPDFNIYDESGNEFKLSDLKGQKVLVSLWAAYDAKSHMQHVLLTNVLKKENYPAKIISVSFDSSKSIFEKTLSMDSIKNEFQHVDTKGSDSPIYKKYQLEKGFSNFLIDENGIIIAINPTLNDLKQVFCE